MLNPGQILDKKYEIIKVLGRGGMGTVYLCKNNRLGNFWAVKEVNGQWKDKIDFLAEPNILKNLSHVGIIRIIDIFYENDNLYIVEDYINGKTLKEYVEISGPLLAEVIVDISLQLCSILGYLHSFNPPIIYRDLKPSNIMIKDTNKVVLIDFGIARTYKENQESDTMIMGSMGFISPEQIINSQSNAKTDIYSLGATMFFMLTGKSINMPSELMFEENCREDSAKGLAEIIQKASAIDPNNRYSNINTMIPELSAILVAKKYEKTIIMNSNESDTTDIKTVLIEDKNLKKRTKLIIIAVLACIIILIIFLVLLIGNKLLYKKTPEIPVTSKIVETTKPKVVVEVDVIVNGILDLKNPMILSAGSSIGKGKGKEKHNNDGENQLEQFNLKPASSISNSKLSIELNNIQVMNKDVITIINIQNTNDAALKLDLRKTYLVNSKNESTKIYNDGSVSLISIPQSLGKQEIKLYFKDFEFGEGSYTLKTVLSSTVNKDINLHLDAVK